MARIRLKYVNAFANGKRKNGRTRYYFRRRGFPAIPLPGLPGSEEFMMAYQMALAAIPERPEIGASRTEPGTIDALVFSYYKSDECLRLAEESQTQALIGLVVGEDERIDRAWLRSTGADLGAFRNGGQRHLVRHHELFAAGQAR